MSKKVRKNKNKDREPIQEQQEPDAKPGSVDFILSMAQHEAGKLEIAKAAWKSGRLSFGDYHRLTVSITDNVAKITRLARDMAGPYMSLGDIHVSLVNEPQVAVPSEDGSVELAEMSVVEIDGQAYYRLDAGEGVINLIPIRDTEAEPDVVK